MFSVSSEEGLQSQSDDSEGLCSSDGQKKLRQNNWLNEITSLFSTLTGCAGKLYETLVHIVRGSNIRKVMQIWEKYPLIKSCLGLEGWGRLTCTWSVLKVIILNLVKAVLKMFSTHLPVFMEVCVYVC